MVQEITLLHVDDDASFGVFVRDWFERAEPDIRVTTATSAEAALELLEAPDHGFDVVVSDYRMPGASGLELFGRVRERGLALPFVLFTGQRNEQLARDVLTTGVTDYVQKTDGTDALSLLVDRVRNAVGRRRPDVGAGGRRYETLIERLDVAAFLFGTDGRLVSFNDPFVDLLGRDLSDLQAADVWSLPIGAERSVLDRNLRSLHDGTGADVVSFRLGVRTGARAPRPCRVDLRAVPCAGGRSEGYVGVLRGVTDPGEPNRS